MVATAHAERSRSRSRIPAIDPADFGLCRGSHAMNDLSAETTTETLAEPKPKRKYTRHKRWNRKAGLAAKEAEAAANEWLAGLTEADCPIACNADGCAITGEGCCGHPRKGGLQQRYLREDQRAVQARFQQARTHLHHLKAEERKE